MIHKLPTSLLNLLFDFSDYDSGVSISLTSKNMYKDFNNYENKSFITSVKNKNLVWCIKRSSCINKLNRFIACYNGDNYYYIRNNLLKLSMMCNNNDLIENIYNELNCCINMNKHSHIKWFVDNASLKLFNILRVFSPSKYYLFINNFIDFVVLGSPRCNYLFLLFMNNVKYLNLDLILDKKRIWFYIWKHCCKRDDSSMIIFFLNLYKNKFNIDMDIDFGLILEILFNESPSINKCKYLKFLNLSDKFIYCCLIFSNNKEEWLKLLIDTGVLKNTINIDELDSYLLPFDFVDLIRKQGIVINN